MGYSDVGLAYYVISFFFGCYLYLFFNFIELFVGFLTCHYLFFILFRELLLALFVIKIVLFLFTYSPPSIVRSVRNFFQYKKFLLSTGSNSEFSLFYYFLLNKHASSFNLNRKCTLSPQSIDLTKYQLNPYRIEKDCLYIKDTCIGELHQLTPFIYKCNDLVLRVTPINEKKFFVDFTVFLLLQYLLPSKYHICSIHNNVHGIKRLYKEIHPNSVISMNNISDYRTYLLEKERLQLSTQNSIIILPLPLVVSEYVCVYQYHEVERMDIIDLTEIKNVIKVTVFFGRFKNLMFNEDQIFTKNSNVYLLSYDYVGDNGFFKDMLDLERFNQFQRMFILLPFSLKFKYDEKNLLKEMKGIISLAKNLEKCLLSFKKYRFSFHSSTKNSMKQILFQNYFAEKNDEGDNLKLIQDLVKAIFKLIFIRLIKSISLSNTEDCKLKYNDCFLRRKKYVKTTIKKEESSEVYWFEKELLTKLKDVSEDVDRKKEEVQVPTVLITQHIEQVKKSTVVEGKKKKNLRKAVSRRSSINSKKTAEDFYENSGRKRSASFYEKSPLSKKKSSKRSGPNTPRLRKVSKRVSKQGQQQTQAPVIGIKLKKKRKRSTKKRKSICTISTTKKHKSIEVKKTFPPVIEEPTTPKQSPMTPNRFMFKKKPEAEFDSPVHSSCSTPKQSPMTPNRFMFKKKPEDEFGSPVNSSCSTPKTYIEKSMKPVSTNNTPRKLVTKIKEQIEFSSTLLSPNKNFFKVNIDLMISSHLYRMYFFGFSWRNDMDLQFIFKAKEYLGRDCLLIEFPSDNLFKDISFSKISLSVKSLSSIYYNTVDICDYIGESEYLNEMMSIFFQSSKVYIDLERKDLFIDQPTLPDSDEHKPLGKLLSSIISNFKFQKMNKIMKALIEKCFDPIIVSNFISKIEIVEYMENKCNVNPYSITITPLLQFELEMDLKLETKIFFNLFSNDFDDIIKHKIIEIKGKFQITVTDSPGIILINCYEVNSLSVRVKNKVLKYEIDDFDYIVTKVLKNLISKTIVQYNISNDSTKVLTDEDDYVENGSPLKSARNRGENYLDVLTYFYKVLPKEYIIKQILSQYLGIKFEIKKNDTNNYITMIDENSFVFKNVYVKEISGIFSSFHKSKASILPKPKILVKDLFIKDMSITQNDANKDIFQVSFLMRDIIFELEVFHKTSKEAKMVHLFKGKFIYNDGVFKEARKVVSWYETKKKTIYQESQLIPVLLNFMLRKRNRDSIIEKTTYEKVFNWNFYFSKLFIPKYHSKRIFLTKEFCPNTSEEKGIRIEKVIYSEFEFKKNLLVFYNLRISLNREMKLCSITGSENEIPEFQKSLVTVKLPKIVELRMDDRKYVYHDSFLLKLYLVNPQVEDVNFLEMCCYTSGGSIDYILVKHEKILPYFKKYIQSCSKCNIM